MSQVERSDSAHVLKLGSVSGINKKLFSILSKPAKEKLHPTTTFPTRKQKSLRQIANSPCLDSVGPS